MYPEIITLIQHKNNQAASGIDIYIKRYIQNSYLYITMCADPTSNQFFDHGLNVCE